MFGLGPATKIYIAVEGVDMRKLDTEPVKIGVRAVMARRPSNFPALQDLKTLKLPGF